MGMMDRSIVKMFRADDPDFEEKNMMVFWGTPGERWLAIREANRLAWNLGGNKTADPDGRLRRDVVRTYTWKDGKEPLKEN
jgi:hypothetical protein